MKSLNDPESVSPSQLVETDGANGKKQSGVVGNERLTALANSVLLVLILIELASAVSLHMGIALHIVVELLLSGPLVVKLGSTGTIFCATTPVHSPTGARVRSVSPLRDKARHLVLRDQMLQFHRQQGG